MGLPSVKNLVEPLLDIPCWSVKQGYGSFLTFELGKPHQEIHSVVYPKLGSKRNYPSRLVQVHGEWHLWVYCFDWRIYSKFALLADSESLDKEISLACKRLDGQALTSVTLDPKKGTSSFIFDLDGRLETYPYLGESKLQEQWMLYYPDGLVYTYRSDGYTKLERSDQVSEESEWVKAT